MQQIIKDSWFVKISESAVLNFETIKEFIENCIYKHPNKNLLLPQLSNLFVLVCDTNSEKFYHNNKSLKNCLSDEQYEFLQKNDKYILGYIWVSDQKSKNDKNIHYIEFIDTRLKGCNIAEHMMSQYEGYINSDNVDNNCLLLPKEIIDTAVGYWIKNLNFLGTKKETEQYISDKKLKEDKINWDLYLTKLQEIENNMSTDSE